MNGADAFRWINAKILIFTHLLKSFTGRRFYPKENTYEVCFDHGRQQLGALRQVYRSLRREGERIIMALLPYFQSFQQSKSLWAVPNEIVVNEKDLFAPSQFQQPVEFRNYL